MKSHKDLDCLPFSHWFLTDITTCKTVDSDEISQGSRLFAILLLVFDRRHNFQNMDTVVGIQIWKSPLKKHIKLTSLCNGYPMLP